MRLGPVRYVVVVAARVDDVHIDLCVVSLFAPFPDNGPIAASARDITQDFLQPTLRPQSTLTSGGGSSRSGPDVFAACLSRYSPSRPLLARHSDLGGELCG